jgi:CubicO group peptidase (beta-lactamase class C family)
MMQRLTTVTGLVIALSTPALAQTAHDPIDHYIHSEMARRHIPGLALLVIRDGKIVRAQGYGFANLEHQVPVRPETIFQSGSMGKQFTATAVMMLVEEGKIGLDDSITKYFPDAPPAWKPVTIRQLLSHTAGFGDYPKDFNLQQDRSEGDMLKVVESQALAFTPGTSWAYSNLGYVTLGILIHRVSGQFYGHFLQERVFRPLGMTSTRIISELDIIPNRAAGYQWVKDEWKNQDWVAPSLNTTADGSLYFNILDLAKWDAALDTEKLLKRSSLELMWTPVKLSNGRPNSDGYGFGWRMDSVRGHRVIEHAGQWQGFNTNISRYPDDKLTVVVLTNLAHCEPQEITHGVAGLYVPELRPEEKAPGETLDVAPPGSRVLGGIQNHVGLR